MSYPDHKWFQPSLTWRDDHSDCRGLLDRRRNWIYVSSYEQEMPPLPCLEYADMSLLVNRGNLRRFLMGFICLLVFFFVLQSKLELYGQGFNTPVHPYNSSKLRIEASQSKILLPAITIRWFVAGATYRLLLDGRPLVQVVSVSLISHDQRLPSQERFQRPPPRPCS